MRDSAYTDLLLIRKMISCLSQFVSRFRRDNPSIILPNQHSNGLLDFNSISDSDIGQYVCHGENRVGFTEDIATIEFIGIYNYSLYN